MLNLVCFFDKGLWREVLVSLQCKTRSGWQNYVYGSIMLKIILVALLTHQKPEIKEKSQTFGQFGAPQYAMENECFTAPSKSTGWFLLLFCPKNDLV